MLLLRLVFAVLLAMVPALAATVDFNRDVRTILSDNCFRCHGPDKDSRMSELRLDRKLDAFAARAAGAPIVPNNPSASLVYQRISSAKMALRMPPASTHKTLSPAQIETVKRWIEEGAPWSEQWAFTTPTRPAVPPVGQGTWPRNPIDNFVLAKLETAGLSPTGEASRRKLARRLALDLTGLPPEPADVEAFVNDGSADAYERLVDRYLASPHYGEHRARYWLDAARYADTNGIHIDNYREIWPYRDWVINAFNRNMPFDQFTIEQIAGDLLPNPTMDQLVATGFHRCNVTTNEAGIIPAEFEAIYAKDRVDTTGAVWLGLTVGCATCHDHKFDPILQRDHYALAAFFRNTTQPVMDGNVSDTNPVIIVPAKADRARWAGVVDEEAGVVEKLRASEKEARQQPSTKPVRPLDDDSEILARPEETTFAAKQTVELASQAQLDVSRAFTIAFWMKLPETENSVVVFSQYDRGDDKKEIKPRGMVFDVGGRMARLRLTGDEGKNLDIRAGNLNQMKEGVWTHVAVSYDGSGERQGFTLYLDGKHVELQGSEPLSKVSGNFHVSRPLLLGGDGRRTFPGGAIRDFRIHKRALSDSEARLLYRWPEIAAGDAGALALYRLRHEDPDYQALAQQEAKLVVERRAMRRRAAVTHVMVERSDQKPFANILFRGMYDQPRDRVEPDVPNALPPMRASQPRNRLGLAQWLVDPENPLTARVTMNRLWQEIFGTGIVRTAEDFGSQGEPPSHPELLDWMAVEFREAGWDVKKMVRLLVTSATYRQDAMVTPERLQADPDNRLLSRGPRFRMDGEMIRDYALASSGLLNRTIGGPSVKPYQPAGVWETVAMDDSNTRFYKRDGGDKLYRRSMYTFWKRSAPPASMDIFNAPTREACTVRRERTNTPLQALVTMNDVQFMEAARALAERSLAVRSLDARIDLVSARLLARTLESNEREIARREYQDFLRYFDSHPADAKKLIEAGDHRSDRKLPAAELSAMTMLVNQMMNLDEVLVK